MRLFRRKQPERAPTAVDTIDDTTWRSLDNDEQRLLYVIERRQLGRSTRDQYLQDLADWRRGYTLRVELDLRSRP